MTFFHWPPDPNNDWRQLYFLSSNGTPWYNSQATNTSQTSTSSASTPSAYPSNSTLYASNGSLNGPNGNYQINYKAILAWISANCVQQSAGDGRPFPSVLRAANTSLYSYIPTDVPASAYTWANGNQSISWPDSSTRFWKEYIDFVIGVYQDPFNNIQVPGTSTCSYGPDYTAGSSTSGQYVSISGTDATVYINGLSTSTRKSPTAAPAIRQRRPSLSAHRKPRAARPPLPRPPFPAAPSRRSRLPTPAQATLRRRPSPSAAEAARMLPPPRHCKPSPS